MKSIGYPYNEEYDLSNVYNRIKKFKKMSFREFDIKHIDAIKNKFQTIKARNGQRNQAIYIEFSTTQWKEPINKWRKQTDF